MSPLLKTAQKFSGFTGSCQNIDACKEDFFPQTKMINGKQPSPDLAISINLHVYSSLYPGNTDLIQTFFYSAS